MVGRVARYKEASSDVVSLLDLSHPSVKKRIEDGRAKYFLPYNENVITFIINPEIENQESKRLGELEVQIKDKGPLTYFTGIIIPDDKECQQRVFDTLEKFNINLPIFNYDGERLDKNEIKETSKGL